MRNIKAAWLWFWRLPYWVSLIVSISLFGWSHFDKVQREQVRQQQKIELDLIDIERDRLGRDIEQYKRVYRPLFARKRWDDADHAQAKIADEKLKSLGFRLDEIKRRTREVCGSEN